MGTIVPIFLILFMGWKKSQPTAISSLLSGAVSSLILFLRSAAQMLWIVDVRGICAQMECKWNSGLNVHKYLTAANEDEGPRLFLMMSSDKPRGNSTKCNMNTGKAFFYCEVVKQVSQRGCGVCLWRHSKPDWTGHCPLQAVLDGSAWAGGVETMISRGSFHSKW